MKVRCLFSVAVLAAWFSTLTQSLGGILDTSFDPGTGANGIVEQVLQLPDGRILVCGNFTSFNGSNHGYIARLNSNGSVDQSFYAQPSYWVRHMSVQTDGKIIIAGYFKGVQGAPRGLIARLNQDGSLDTSFNTADGASVSIGKGIDGNPDPFVFWTAIQPDGKILATGNFSNYNGNASIGIVRINPDGSRDTSFNVGGGLNSWGRSINVLPNAQILVSGWFTNYREKSANRLVRINPDGSPDMGFNPYFGDQTAVYSTALVANNKIVVAGHTVNPDGSFNRKFEQLNWDGSIDTSFVGFTNEKTEDIAVQSDGKIIVGGYFNAVDGVVRQSVGRVNPDGTLDTSWSASIDNYVWTVALQSDGKLLISGGFYTVDGVSRNGVARLLTGASGGGGATPPVAPSLSASANSTTQITLSWTDSATDRSGYSVERKTGVNGTYAAIASLGASARSYVNSGLTAGTTYYYRLRATTTSGASVYSNEAYATTAAASGGTATATFVASDSTTKGTWKGVYGSDGYSVFSDVSNLPSYATVTPLNKSDWIWAYSTTDTRAVQKANSTDRLAACWYSGTGYQIDLAIKDGLKHRVSLYFLDWDNGGRNETVKILDGDTGAPLFSQSLSGFSGGVYLSWDIGGHVKFSLTPNSGNAVASAMFFGGGATGGGGGTSGTVATPTITPNGGTYSASPSISLADATTGAEIRFTIDGTDPTATSTLYTSPFTLRGTATVKAKGFKSGMTASGTAAATFTISSGGGTTTGANFAYIGSDTTTRGNWKGVYGADGYNVIGSSSKNPTYISPTGVGKSDWVWNQTTTDTRALQTADGLSRVAGCWYSSSSFTIDLPITDGATHRIAVYFCDWDSAGRAETIDLLNGDTGAVLQTLSLSNFAGGQYLKWDFKGHVKLRITKVAGPNAVVNGFFFGAPAKQL